MKIVDAWMQHPTQRFAGQPMFESLRRWMGVEEFPALPFDFTIAAMDAGGVNIGMAAAWCGPQGWLISHDDVAEFAAEHPERIAGVASADLNRPMEAVREIRRAVNDLGFKAVRIVPWLWNLPPNDRRYYPIYTACCDLGVPFCTQIGHTGPLCPSEPGRPIPYLDEVLLDFPELVVVGGHVGFPWESEVLSLARKYPNFYIDTSAYKVKRLPESIVAYMRGRGQDKVLFGTNFPMIQPEACLKRIDDLGLDDLAKEKFLHANADRIFGLE